MKTVTNQTGGPLKVPLPQGKILHLGPRQKGQIADPAAEHPPLMKLVEEGKLKVEDDAGGRRGGHESGPGGRTESHGHHPPSQGRTWGER
jgi:hypothetical protein